MTVINVSRLWREENLKLGHSIPIGTLVEVDIEYSSHHGLRAFVCEHTRDCDGTPMYALYYSKDFKNLEYVKEINYHVYRGMIVDGFSDECLKVV
jgi:hypothetical protein